MPMKNTLAYIWRRVKGVYIKDLSPSLFLFQFFHKLDVERVIKGGPWTFNQNLLFMRQLETGINPLQVSLFHAEFWVQVHEVPCRFMSEKGECLGSSRFSTSFIHASIYGAQSKSHIS
ncbi:hypothetical protein REPUB_Repub19eG0066800 [Reevesia pubescens]